MSGDIEADFVYNLIKSVEEYKCLYDKRDPNYYNKGTKERTWKVVADMCNKSGMYEMERCLLFLSSLIFFNIFSPSKDNSINSNVFSKSKLFSIVIHFHKYLLLFYHAIVLPQLCISVLLPIKVQL